MVRGKSPTHGTLKPGLTPTPSEFSHSVQNSAKVRPTLFGVTSEILHITPSDTPPKTRHTRLADEKTVRYASVGRFPPKR